MTAITPDDPSWFIDVTTAQLAAELCRRSTTACILLDLKTKPANGLNWLYFTDDLLKVEAFLRTSSLAVTAVMRDVADLE